MKFDGYYINLASATARRKLLEQNVRDCNLSSEISLRRFEGIVPNAIQNEEWHRYLPNFSAGHLGCLLSHKECIRLKRFSPHEGHLLIVEDDVVFSPRTERYLHQAVEKLSDRDWDIFYTDLIVEQEDDKKQLFWAKQRIPENNFYLIDLHRFAFTGLTSYIVNKNSVWKMYEMLSRIDPMTKLIDWHIKEYVNNGFLKAFTIFPFITSLSPEAENSTIDGGIPLSHYNNKFRRLVWIDA